MTMPHPNSVTVLIPTFNRAHLIGESIRSALGQSSPPSEILVVDDGSSDQTGAVVTAFGDRVRYMAKTNAGKSAAINAGLSQIRSEFVLVLDDDDLLPPGALAAHLEALAARPDAGFSYGLYSRFRPEHEAPWQSTDIEPVDPDDNRPLFIRLLEHDFLPNPTWLVRRGAMDVVGPYSEELKRSQDLQMILRLSKAFPSTAVRDVVLWQREHLAPRGPRSERRQAVHTIDLWVKYDALVMQGLDEVSCDEDFAPLELADAPPEAAMLQRAVSNFQRNNFDAAVRHLERYLRALGDRQPTALDLAIGGRLLAASHGLGAAMESAPQVAARLHTLNLPKPLARAMASQASWRFKALVKGRQATAASNLWSFTVRAFGVNPVQARLYRQGRYPTP